MIATSQGRWIYRAGKGKEINRAGEGIARAGYGHPSPSTSYNHSSNRFLIPPHPLTNFEIQKYYAIQDLMVVFLAIIYQNSVSTK